MTNSMRGFYVRDGSHIIGELFARQDDGKIDMPYEDFPFNQLDAE